MLQAFSQSCEEMREETDDLLAEKVAESMEMTSTSLESVGADEEDVVERLKLLKSAVDQRCRELVARKVSLFACP